MSALASLVFWGGGGGGAEEQSPPVKIIVHFGGSVPPNFASPCFSKFIDLASNIFYGIAMMNFFTMIWLLRSL